MSELNFSGRLVIKAQLDDDLRRILIHNEELTYDELILMMQRVFKPKLDNVENLFIKYKDEDDEYVTIAEEFDLSYAIHQHKTLRLKLFLPKQDGPMATETVFVENGASTDAIDHRTIAHELRLLREEVGFVAEKLDRLLIKRESEPSPSASSSVGATGEAVELNVQAPPVAHVLREEDTEKPTEVPPQQQHDQGFSQPQPEQSAHMAPVRTSLNQPGGLGSPNLPPTGPFQQPFSPMSSDTSAPPPPPLSIESTATTQPLTDVNQPPQPSLASTMLPPMTASAFSVAGNAPPLPPQPPTSYHPPSLPPTVSSAHQPAMLPTTNLPPPNLSQQQQLFPVFQPPPAMPMRQPGMQQQQQQFGRPTPPPMRSPMMSGPMAGMVPPPPPMPQPGLSFPSMTSTSAATTSASVPPFGGMPPPMSQSFRGAPQSQTQPSYMTFSGYQPGSAPPPMPPPFQPGSAGNASPFQPGAAPPPPPPLQLGGLPPSTLAGGSPYTGGPYPGGATR